MALRTVYCLIRETDNNDPKNDKNPIKYYKSNKQWVLWNHKDRHLISSIREDFPGWYYLSGAEEVRS